MRPLNFKHLRYFWVVARTGSIARAGEQLHITPQAISGQLAELESALGAKLLRRVGRGLEITEVGRRIEAYADEIFGLETELLDAARAPDAAQARPFGVGISDSVPKLLSHRVLDPALHLDSAVRLVCREGSLSGLLADLAVQRLDMVIADRPMPPTFRVRAFNHRLGGSELRVFGTTHLVRRLRGAFPACLDGAPLLLPGAEVAIRAALDRWLEAHELRPRIVGEFDDSALMKTFGQGGAGLFVAPVAIADYVCRQFGVRVIGRVSGVVEELYAITTERRIQHPAALAIRTAANRELPG